MKCTTWKQQVGGMDELIHFGFLLSQCSSLFVDLNPVTVHLTHIHGIIHSLSLFGIHSIHLLLTEYEYI